MASLAARTANDENNDNIALAKAASEAATDATAPRRVLADVSPNVKMGSPAMGMSKRPMMTGSPLKRSFTAMVEDGSGLTYLKRRRLSSGAALSPTDAAVDLSRSVFSAGGAAAEEQVAGFRPLHAASPDETVGPSLSLSTCVRVC